jgi:hypothetical protein
VIAGGLVPSVSPPMLDAPQSGIVDAPRNIAQPIAPFSTTLITKATTPWSSQRKRRCSALSRMLTPSCAARAGR